MIDAESYGVSGRQLLSSKQVPDSGRVCSWRKPSAWPSSWPMMFLSGQVRPGSNAVLSTSTLRFARALLGKNARARYWPLTLTGLTSNTTLALLAVQLASWAGT